MNEVFKKKLKAKLPMPFHAYMQMALYDVDFGYYTTKNNIIGAQADFITAPELSSLFGFTLAKQIQTSGIADEPFHILELGAGTARLCIDVLTYLKKQQLPIEKYYILDLSPRLKEKQLAQIEALAPQLLPHIVWLQRWPQDFQGVVLANEVLDAMPVHRFLWTGERVFESYIVWDHGLKEEFLPCQDKALEDFVKALELGPSLYCSEVNLWLDPWLKGLYESMSKGLVFLIDYGFTRSEYYHPDRNQGSIMCHQRQQAHSDFLQSPGQTDITAHVDFSLLAHLAHALGFSVLGFSNQASFLLSNGILELLAQLQDEKKYYANAQALKLLLQSQEMGDIFKVMALGKNYDMPLQGFMLQDKRVSL